MDKAINIQLEVQCESCSNNLDIKSGFNGEHNIIVATPCKVCRDEIYSRAFNEGFDEGYDGVQ